MCAMALPVPISLQRARTISASPVTHLPVRSLPVRRSAFRGSKAEANSRGRFLAAPAAAVAVGLATAHPRQVRVKRRQQVAPAQGSSGPEIETDFAGRTRLRYQDDGWESWTWAPSGVDAGPFECHYIVAGPEDGPPVVLVHGFGASSYHWRYQLPALAAQGYRAYAPCLLGYGWGPRTTLRYTGETWAEQLNAFLHNVVGAPAVLVGNSVGAFASLIAASFRPELCRGLVLLNAAGRFEERQPGMPPARPQLGDVLAKAAEEAEPGPLQWFLGQLTRTVAAWAFWATKLTIQPILEWVYVDHRQVDEDLVKSIRTPADHPLALDTFGQVIQAGRRTEVTVFQALDNLPSSLPLLLLWGMQDPWMRPERAAAIMSECKERDLECRLVEIDAGHCPQDDAPDAVNGELFSWLRENGIAKTKEAVTSAS